MGLFQSIDDKRLLYSNTGNRLYNRFLFILYVIFNTLLTKQICWFIVNFRCWIALDLINSEKTMKKGFFLITLILLFQNTFAVNNINGLRKCFHESVLDESKVDDFHKKAMNISAPSALQTAYQAVSFALLAKKVWNPVEKISFINRYGKLIDKAIKSDPDNIEIRFLRLSIDYHTPMIMGRKNNVCSDKSLILTLLEPIGKFNIDSSFNRFSKVSLN